MVSQSCTVMDLNTDMHTATGMGIAIITTITLIGTDFHLLMTTRQRKRNKVEENLTEKVSPSNVV